MTRRIPNPSQGTAEPYRGEPVRMRLEGEEVRGYEGESMAVALFASGARVLSRSLKYHRPRSFFCLEGHCGACLMRVDGVPNIRTCMEPCRDGARLDGQNAYPSPDLDVLEAVDWLFPKGMNHHTLMTGSRMVNAVVNKVVRQLSGLGQLPDAPAESVPPVRTETPAVCVIGAGPAGLAAATAAAQAGADTLLVDEQDRVGGHLLADPRHGLEDAIRREGAARDAGVRILTGATAIGYYPEDPPAVLAVATRTQLVRVKPRRYVYATGGYAVNRLFPNNDRPGVLAARAVGRMLVRHGVVPGTRVCIVGDDEYARVLAEALRTAECEVAEVDDRSRRVTGVRGRTWVTAVEVADADGRKSRIDCDLVAVAAMPAPASEAPRQHGCEVELRPDQGGYAVLVDADGHTSVEDVLACGDVCGHAGAAAAADAGRRAGEVAAREATAQAEASR